MCSVQIHIRGMSPDAASRFAIDPSKDMIIHGLHSIYHVFRPRCIDGIISVDLEKLDFGFTRGGGCYGSPTQYGSYSAEDSCETVNCVLNTSTY